MGAIGTSAAPAAVKPRSFNGYFGVVEGFLIWALTALQSRDPARITKNMSGAKFLTQRAFAANRLSIGRSRALYGLSREDFDFLWRVIHPTAAANPFRHPVRLRNYLIIRILVETGLRRGELLKLRIEDVITVGSSPQIKVVRRPDDPVDPRAEEPGLKTEERTIPITLDLCRLLIAYLQPGGAGRGRPRPGHPYFFTSSRGALPLTLSAVNRIFMQIVARFDRFKGKGVLTPHTMRRSFNDRLCETARAEGWPDDKIADLQKYLNGWSNSQQATIYTRRFTEQAARELASQMQAQLYPSEVAA